ncbi:MAG: hypothetical protein IJW73_08590 [Candidatus Gastranaerophilales bacterium]|nr:hypothetical protein [Candidatus Gastranaerophilales bacterium]
MMSNFKNYLKNSAEFAKKYIGQYFKLLIKPIIVGAIGLVSVGLVYIHPLLAILALLISIPCVCYSFWNGYVVTYSLINVSNTFINSEEKELKDCLINNEEKKQLALWLGFCALISIVAFLPAMIFMGKSVDIIALLTNPSSLLSNTQNLGFVSLICLITTIILLPFLNFFNQAFYFKKEDEKFINAFINCYKKLDSDGIKLSIVFTIAGGILSCFGYIYPILALVLNLFTFSANTFWFREKIEEVKEENTL